MLSLGDASLHTYLPPRIKSERMNTCYDRPPYVETLLGNMFVGSRGKVNLTLAEPGKGLMGTTAMCVCDYMWTGPLCSHPCPYPYDEAHGRGGGLRRLNATLFHRRLLQPNI